MHLKLIDKENGIEASNGTLSIKVGPISYVYLNELTLGQLQRVYQKWQFITYRCHAGLGTILLNQPTLAQEILDLLVEFGIKDPTLLTISQIQCLLFFHGEEPSILWRFHSTFPSTLDLPKDEDELEVDLSAHVDLDIFETAQLYLLQENKLALIEKWPLSRIMRLLMSKGFMTWVSSTENRERLFKQEKAKFVEENPLDPQSVIDMMKGYGNDEGGILGDN